MLSPGGCRGLESSIVTVVEVPKADDETQIKMPTIHTEWSKSGSRREDDLTDDLADQEMRMAVNG